MSWDEKKAHLMKIGMWDENRAQKKNNNDNKNINSGQNQNS
jgi:hypothetical protein